ncbi:hypothetical protein EZV62_025058 [Acer yangbiense]|uniref:CCHC-type domain-containing protein n=1 Tax=Acer yangbiense TaxID=1000413 RepID=A0A5C7GWQ6_9ROSI|nr:hypothetical protein EZV62_025058 [Acer yangbiense]
MTEEIGRFLGSIVGEVVEFDDGVSGTFMAKFLRVWVILETDKPLCRCLKVDVLGDGVESVMLVKYERLPNFCFRCGLLGHTIKECPDKPKIVEAIKAKEFLFGSWLRAYAPPKRLLNGGRRWSYEERGVGFPTRDKREQGNWRNMERDGVGRNGGRSEDSRLVVSGSHQQGPFLESGSKGKMSESTIVYRSNAKLEGLPRSSAQTEIQEPRDSGGMSLNKARELRGENFGPTNSGSIVMIEVGLRSRSDPMDQRGSVENLAHAESKVSGAVEQVMMGLNNLVKLPMEPVFKFGDPIHRPLNILDTSYSSEHETKQTNLEAQNP